MFHAVFQRRQLERADLVCGFVCQAISDAHQYAGVPRVKLLVKVHRFIRPVLLETTLLGRISNNEDLEPLEISSK